MFSNFPKGVNIFFDNSTVAAIVGLLFAGLFAYIISRYSLGFWAWWRRHLTEAQYAWRRQFRRRKPLVVCLDDYVYILEKLRDSIAKRCSRISSQNGNSPEILICVYTRQLPSDWPLWGALLNPNENPQTSLERYIRDFHRFLNEASHRGYSVSVNRVIVIDNGLSKSGIEKCLRICQDRHEPSFKRHWDTYIRYLHNNDLSGASVYWTKRPWPGWISDAVFYGVKEPNKPLRWLWGVTTSYDAGEDLVLLRLHSKLNRELDGRWCNGGLVLPPGVKTLKDLANRARAYPNAVQLVNLPSPWEPWKGVP
jgi:hypothetical protein